MNERLMPKRTRTTESILPSLVDTASHADDEQIASADREHEEDRAEATGELPAGHSISRITVQPRARYTLSQPGDSSEREADQTADHVMRGGTAPRLSAISAAPQSAPDVMRAAGDAASVHDDDVPDEVDEALQTDGQPLSESVRTLMEPRFGHAFGNVRVHTDSRAAESAQAINALAYTVGNDVVFGNGRYAPETDAGQYLIAHELTHVVQQSAAPAGQQAARMVQRAVEEVKKEGWGNTILHDDSWMKFDPSAEVDPAGQAKIPVDFPVDTRQRVINLPEGTASGSVSMWAGVSWFRNMWDGNMSGSNQAFISTEFKITPDNKIEWSAPQAGTTGNGGTGAMLVVPVPVVASGDTIQVTPMINGMGTVGTSSGTSGGVSVGASASYSKGVSTGSVSGPGVESRTYSVKLVVAPIPLSSYSFPAFFKVDSDVVNDDTEALMVRWFQTELPDGVRKSVQSGATKIFITGHASTTNTISYNRDLAERRTSKVEKILRSYISTEAKVVHSAPSFTQAAQYDQDAGKVDKVVEDPNERRVDVEVTYANTPGTPAAPGAGTPKP